MGLKFGGFKAKLFGRGKQKGATDVVCLSYKIHTDIYQSNS